MALQYDIVVVGTGFSGLCVAQRLRESGCSSLLILEKAASVGGTWRDNRYPGCACDIPSVLYSLSSAPSWDWKRHYGSRGEILAYLEDFAARNELMSFIRFGANVVSIEWNEESAHWTIRLQGGDSLSAQKVVLAVGGLHVPKNPSIKGLEQFRGHIFHSSEWKEQIDLKGLKVGVVGTGASAIQIVPEIAATVDKLLVFQRTPAWILPRYDGEIPDVTDRRKGPNPIRVQLRRLKQYLIQEILTLVLRKKGLAVSLLERAARAHLHNQVSDPALRDALTPRYTIGCKRILLSSTYYPALTHANTTLVTGRIKYAAEDGLTTDDGMLHALDAIILATGFWPNGFSRDIEIKGMHGRTLSDAWSKTPGGYWGISVHGFPNLFLMCGPNTGLGHNSILVMIEAQAEHIARAYRCMRRSGYARLEVKEASQETYLQEVQRRLSKTVWQAGGCKSWYHGTDGQNIALWPGISAEYAIRARRFSKEKYLVDVRGSGSKGGQSRSFISSI